jgi:hypothetical protein
MPWTRNSQAKKHTRKANTPKKQRMWRHVAESARKRGLSEGAAVRMANGVVKKRAKKGRRSSR